MGSTVAHRVHQTAPALMYHDIVAAGHEDGSGFPGRDAALYKVTPDRFEEHLSAVCEVRRPESERCQPAHLGPRTSRLAPVLTFDDGGVSAMAAADALERHGLAGHFFVTGRYIGAPGFLDARQICELHARGHVVGSHSWSHPLRMGHCSRAQLADEWTWSCAALADILGSRVTIASVPGGDFAPAVAEAACAAGIQRLFTSEPSARPRIACGLVLQGRFTVNRWTTAQTVRGLVDGTWLARSRQVLTWNAKKLSKRLAGAHYLRVRRLLLRHGNEVRWGDL